MTPPGSGPPDPWLIASVAILCTFTVIFSYCKILKRCNTRSNPNHRRTLLNETNADDPSLQFQRQGLDFTIIRSLPITQFKKKSEAEDAEEHQSNTDCPVCLGEFEEGEWLRHLPKCNHAFHISCIDTWFVAHSNCPLCRSEVYDFIQDCPIPMHTLLETLRESVIEERALHFQMLRSAVLENSPFGREARFSDGNV
ncbi:RING-H2 finger protein ATL52 [Rosa sericea]